MNNTVVKAEKYGILFIHPNSDTYPVSWWQIAKDGFTYWHNHLMEKRWFTDELSRQFTDLCMEHDYCNA